MLMWFALIILIALIAVAIVGLVLLGALPGKIFTGSVIALVQATGEGDLSGSGELRHSSGGWPSHSQIIVSIRTDEDMLEAGVPIGGVGAAAIYTDRAKPISIVRKVIIRMYAWQRYVL